MSVFKDAWEHLDTPDIRCSNDDSFVLNHWGVSLGIMIVFYLLFMIVIIMEEKKVKEIESDDEREKRNGKCWTDVKACYEQKKNILGDSISLMSTTCRKYPFIHYYAICSAMISFSLVLILFQRFPKSQLAPLAFIIGSSAVVGCLIYYAMIARLPMANVDDKEYWMYSPRNVYQDLSAPIIHPLAIFCIQSLLTIIYVLAVFDEKFPPCINNTAAYSLYSIAAILKALYYGVDIFHSYRNLLDDRKLWTETYTKLFPELGGAQYNLAWASSPPMEGGLSEWQWYLRSFFDVFVNWFIHFIIYNFMIIQSANGDLQDFVLNFVAAEFILRLDDYATFGYETTFCIVKRGKDPPDKLPTTAVEGALDEMELRFKRENDEAMEKALDEMKLHCKRENEEAMELYFKEKNNAMELHFKEKFEAMELRFKDKNGAMELRFKKETNLRIEEMELRFKENNEDRAN